MRDGFDDYMAEMVDRTIADFEADPTNRRRAFLACVATFHGIDVFGFREGQTPGVTRAVPTGVGSVRDCGSGSACQAHIITTGANSYRFRRTTAQRKAKKT